MSQLRHVVFARRHFTWLLLLALALSPNTLRAEDVPAERDKDPLAGHSAHGEAFNEGPRQKAKLMGDTGNVHIEVTSKSPEVQAFFDQGLGQLHGFWYFEAERSFRQAAAIDPDGAMAYWGMAMANYSNDKRGKEFIKEAVGRQDKVSDREKLWIKALNDYFNGGSDKKKRWTAFINGLEDIDYKYPEELEARAFLCWSIYTASRSGLPFSSHRSVDALIGEVLDENPMHPVHHYRIHLWDYKKAERAVTSAAMCGPSAPSIAHMWHMPGHIYWRLKRYHDSAYQQEASARVDHAQMVRDRVMPYQIHNFAHNNEWLTRSLTNVGRAHDAVALAMNMIDLPRHPTQNKLSNRGSSAYYGRRRLMEVLTLYEMWDEVLRLSETRYLDPTDNTDEQIRRLRLIGIAHYALGNPGSGQEIDAELETLLAQIEQEKQEAEDKAVAKVKKDNKDGKKNEKDLEKEIDKAKKTAGNAFTARLSAVKTAREELAARQMLADGDLAGGLAKLEKIGGVQNEHVARLWLEADNPTKAIELAKKEHESDVQQVYPLANYIHVLYSAGKFPEAKRKFAELQELSSALDLDMPVFARLEPLSKEMGLDTDWRQPRETPEDLGQRPSLDTLGPFRWYPAQATPWSLPNEKGEIVSLDQYRGKNVLVIFYLGFGCLHCAEQIDKFAPMAEKFREAGIELVAISTEDKESLQRSLDKYRSETEEPREFPFPLVCDPEHEVFKQYRTYDDFEDFPLHGTMLIDGDGRIRWQDISYEPFMEAEFLLEESQRLLSIPHGGEIPTQTAAAEK